MKARNASGLSPQSDTATATVPAAEEEEELITASQTAADNTLVSNLGSPASGLSFSTQRNVDRRRYAQTFSAANNADGTQAKFDFEGLTFGFSGSATGNLAASHLVVTVNADNSGAPGSVLYLLTSATTTLSRHIDDIREFTFNAPTGATLTSGVTYWLIFAAAPGSNYFDRDYINLALTQDDGEVQGTETVNHWSIGDTSLYDTGSEISQTEQRVVMVAVLGLQLAAPLVSNLGQTSAAPIQIFDDKGAAQAFVAAPDPVHFGYHFQGIRVSARGFVFSGELLIPQVRASLHGDSGGIPGARLHTLTMPLDFASTETFTDYTLLAPPGTVLRGGARYWVVFEVLINNLYLEATNSADEDQTPPPVDGWLIDNDNYAKQASGWVIKPRVIKLAVLGEPEWDTDEPDGEDFPGADFNAHETTGVVTVGTASSGLMTAGVDRNHGQTGDYWYLDTQPGRSYRVEVTFGANAGISTGGSAGINFLDPDGVDYASSCCESDHNREDSATFVHFTHSHQSREWNRSYMVKVAAYDLYNEGTAVYNGPYLITLTDITGVQQMVHSFRGGKDYPATDLLETGEDTADIAVSFRTGPHSDGYTLDRIQVLFHHIPAGDANQIVALHPDVSGSPGNTEECYLRTDRIAESAVAWNFKPPHTFLATFCASVTLTANTTYWIVFPMTNRNDEVVALATTPEVTDSYGSGWSVVGSGKRGSGAWETNTDAQGRIGLWAEEN